MAITNKKTLEKMKKKNLLSIRVGKDGKVTNPGKTLRKKEFLSLKAEKIKQLDCQQQQVKLIELLLTL